MESLDKFIILFIFSNENVTAVILTLLKFATTVTINCVKANNVIIANQCKNIILLQERECEYI